MSQIHDREMHALGDLAEASELSTRVLRSHLRVTQAVLNYDRAMIPEDVWQAAVDAEAVTQESS